MSTKRIYATQSDSAGGIGGSYVPGHHEMETASGKYVDLLAPDPGTIDIEDIAHHLSRLCRYTGAVTCEHYSVAEHAVLVADRLADQGHSPAVCFGGLHHDDAEAYLGDVGRPLKTALRDYGDLEFQMLEAIWQALHAPRLTTGQGDAIKDADEWALAVEARQLMRSRGIGWASIADIAIGTRPVPSLGRRADDARALYLATHYSLLRALGRDAVGEVVA